MLLFQTSKVFLKSWQKLLYLFFAIFAFYLIYLVYEPQLLYLNLQPFFGFDSAFYEYHFDFKSGIISLLSQFFLQFLYFPFAGTSLIIFLLVLLALVYRRILRKSIEAGYVGIEFIVPLFILYQLKSYSVGLDSLIVLLFSGILYLLADFAKLNTYVKAVYIILAVQLAYLLFGIPAAFVLLLIYLMDEWVNIKSVRDAAFSFIVLAYFAGLSYGLKDLNIFQKLNSQFSFTDSSYQYPGFWFICIFIAVAFLLKLLPLSHLFKKFGEGRKQVLLNLIFPVFLLAGCNLFYKTLFINKDKYKSEIDFLVERQEWEKVLEFKDKLGLDDRIAIFQMNRALSETGRMSEDLFSVPQDWGEYGLMMTKEISQITLPYESDLCFDLGYMKAAKYWMLEYQSYTPYTPGSLKRLALSSLFLGEYRTASKYLLILSKSIVYKKYALGLLKDLKKDPDFTRQKLSPENLAIIREENVMNLKSPDLDLIDVLKNNPSNKMAFEYLMSYYILRGELENFYHYLPLVKSSGYYKKMPKTYEEVLLVYYQNSNSPADTWEYSVTKETRDRFEAFKNTIRSNRDSKVNMKDILRPGFHDTFWYYIYFENPTSMADKIKKKDS